MNFPDLVKDPADILPYSMDWTNRLPGSAQIASIASPIQVNGDCTVVDATASYPAKVLTLTVSGGSDTGFTGDPQIATLSVVTVVATLDDGSRMSRSFNVIERQL